MIKVIVFISVVLFSVYASTQEEDKVDPALLAKLGLDYTETVYSGYLPVNDDGSAYF